MGGQCVDKAHIRHLMLFEFRKHKNATDATNVINSVYPDALDVRTCQRWFKKFKKGDFDLLDGIKTGRPTEFDKDPLLAEIEADPKQTIQDLATKLKTSWSTIQRGLKQLNKVQREGIWVPHQLSVQNKIQRVTICSALLSRLARDAFLQQIVTGDEKWILYCNPHKQKQWLSPGQTASPTAKPGLHPKKVLLSVWWDYKGIIYYELLKPNVTINAEYYCAQLDRLNTALSQKRPRLMNRNGAILQHDNARPHSARITQEKIKQLGWEVLPHPPYSPDAAPSDYHLFRSMEYFLRGKKFTNLTAVENAVEEYFNSKPSSFFERGIKSLRERWTKIINNDGDYIID